MDKIFENHELHLIEEGDNFKLYQLKDNRYGYMQSCYISFSMEHICIFGDMVPRNHGVNSIIGYGENWFSKELGQYYLCEKFLEKDWFSELAVNHLKDKYNLEYYFGENYEDYEDEINDMITSLECGEMGCEGLANAIEAICEDTLEEMPGYGYNPRDADLLHAIQKRFSKLKKEEDSNEIKKHTT